jgi:hypothetical protein
MFNSCLINYAIIDPMNEQMTRLYDAANKLKKIEGQSAVALLLNQSPQTLNNWEARGMSSKGILLAEKVIGCSAQWLTSGTGTMINPSNEAPPFEILMSADTQAVINMMESTDAEGKILAKNAVIEALDKYQARQSKRNTVHSAADIDTNLARLLDGIAQVDALAKLDDLRLQIEAKISEQKSGQKRPHP